MYARFRKFVVLFIALCVVLPLSAQAGQQAEAEFYQAISGNKIEQVKAAIDHGADVNALNGKDSLLCVAIGRGRLEIARLIIASPRVNVNLRSSFVDGMGDEWERTALILAARRGFTDLVELLLNKGADINARDRANGSPLSKGSSALIFAAYADHLDTVRLLLHRAKKPDVLLRDREGKSAFWWAVENQNFEMVKLLYANGSRINTPDALGQSVVTTTVLHKNTDILDFLVSKGIDINLVDNRGFSPLMSAVGTKAKSEKAVLKYLTRFLTFKPKINFVSDAGSALHVATRLGFVEAMELLLDNGANIDIAPPATGQTALYTAAGTKNLDAAKYLLKRGAKTEIPDKAGTTPLLVAVLKADPDMVEVLVDGAAVIDTRGSANVLLTPLIAAAANVDPFVQKECFAIMKILLNGKGDVNFPAGNGRTALMAAAMSSDRARALEKGEWLIDRDANIDLVNNRGETALMLAAGAGNGKLVALLVDKGADLQHKNGAGESVMNYANRSGQQTVVAFLQSRGAKQVGPIVRTKVIVKSLLGTWQGYQDGMPQVVFTYVLNKNSTFDFVSRLTPEALKYVPAGSVKPVIAAHKGTYTFEGDTLILDLVGAPPVSSSWKLENNVLVIDNKIRLKKIR